MLINKFCIFKDKLKKCRSTEDGLIYYINFTNETVNIIQSNQEQVLSWDLLRELQESPIQKIKTEKLSLERHHIDHIVNNIQEGCRLREGDICMAFDCICEYNKSSKTCELLQSYTKHNNKEGNK